MLSGDLCVLSAGCWYSTTSWRSILDNSRRRYDAGWGLHGVLEKRFGMMAAGYIPAADGSFDGWQVGRRVETHIFVAFLAYCLTVTLRVKLNIAAPGLTP
ncbi:MAG: hypothetical protein JXQ75_17460, partial [Phycisphaerae bacterium]|nr:hypothetical protein [Phycisphaerae bacterium]